MGSGVTSNFGPPCKKITRAPLPNDIAVSRTCYWWGIRSEAPLVLGRYRDSESLEGGRVWGWETSPADEVVGGALQAPSAGSGRSPGSKRVLMHLEPVYVFLTNFHWTTLHSPSFPPFSPPHFLPLPPFSSRLSPSIPNPFPRFFPFLATKQPPKIPLSGGVL